MTTARVKWQFAASLACVGLYCVLNARVLLIAGVIDRARLGGDHPLTIEAIALGTISAEVGYLVEWIAGLMVVLFVIRHAPHSGSVSFRDLMSLSAISHLVLIPTTLYAASEMAHVGRAARLNAAMAVARRHLAASTLVGTFMMLAAFAWLAQRRFGWTATRTAVFIVIPELALTVVLYILVFLPAWMTN